MKEMEMLSFLKKAGFIWGPEPEIYGGIAGFHTFAPLGKRLKNNVEEQIRLLFKKHGFWEVECPIVTPEVVWKASGHLSGFVDPLIKCKKCSAVYRADELIKEAFKVDADAFTNDQLLKFIKDKKMKCIKCKGDFVDKIEDYNLMMKTTIGVDTCAFNRPETATTTYLPFKNYYDFFRKKLPIKVFQIGKAFRNEISPRQSVMRGREFTQAEAQIMLSKEQEINFPEYGGVKKDKLLILSWEQQVAKGKVVEISVEDLIKKKTIKKPAYAWALWLGQKFFEDLGIPKERIRIRQHNPEKLAHYADDAWDLEVNLNSYGWYEMLGIHDRTHFDLETHSKHSGQKLVAKDEKNNDMYPEILEIAFGSDRPTFALLDIFYDYDKQNDRIVMRLPKHMAPIQVAVFPLMAKDKMDTKAKEVFEMLLDSGIDAIYDEAGSIGKRYRRMDQVGTPFCITIDHDTLEDNTVTIRERDSMKQERVNIKDLIKSLKF